MIDNKNGFRAVHPEDFSDSPFRMIGKDWMLVLSEARNKQNAMTASWGSFGRLWERFITTVFLRPERHTRALIEESGVYSLNFFDASFRKTLAYMGSVSGKKENKVEKSGLTVVHDENGIPYFKEAKTVFICKKLSGQQIVEDDFVEVKKSANDDNSHFMYIGEIQQILLKGA